MQLRCKKELDARVARHTIINSMGIRSIRHRGLKQLYESGEARGLPAAMVPKIADILLAIDEATHPQDVALFPGWRLHPLKGSRRGLWSVTVTGDWRVIFRFERGDAFDVDLVDDH